MILQETVLVTLHPSNIIYYENLGYVIPRRKDKWNRINVPKRTQIEVKVSDLPKNSNIKVLCKCDECGKKIEMSYQNYNAYLHQGVYRCLQCSRNTEDYKQKISKKSKGRKHSKETKNKMSQNSYSHKMAGINHPNYNPNISEKERKSQHQILGIGSWKKEVKERDKYTCQKCGYVSKPNNFLHAHHIDNFSNFKNKRLDINNGITFCENCHKDIHKLFGKFTTKENLNEFIKK